LRDELLIDSFPVKQIVLGTITSAADALQWMRTTFFYQVAVVSGNRTDDYLTRKIQDEMQALSAAECVHWDAQVDQVKPLDLGKIMVRS
jgi:hypothetical protein